MQTVKVLIVDDARQVREELETVLTLTTGIEVVGQAANGLEAVQLTKTLHPDVVLLDLEMPVLDGYEAARKIRTHCPCVYLVALTVHGYEEARYKALQAGVDIFMVKGAPVDQLVSALFQKGEKNDYQSC